MKFNFKNWRRPRLTPFLVIAALVAIVFVFAVWRFSGIEMAYDVGASAPQGQFTGPADAKLTITEFMDYPCVPCRHMKDVLADVQARHPEVRIVYRDLPTEKYTSVREASVAAAAGLQGHFVEAHNALLTATDPVTEDTLPEFCKKIGADCPQLLKDMHSRGVMISILQTTRAAGALGIHAVPAFVIGHTVYAGTTLPTAADFDAMIAAAEAQK